MTVGQRARLNSPISARQRVERELKVRAGGQLNLTCRLALLVDDRDFLEMTEQSGRFQQRILEVLRRLVRRASPSARSAPSFGDGLPSPEATSTEASQSRHWSDQNTIAKKSRGLFLARSFGMDQYQLWPSVVLLAMPAAIGGGVPNHFTRSPPVGGWPCPSGWCNEPSPTRLCAAMGDLSPGCMSGLLFADVVAPPLFRHAHPCAPLDGLSWRLLR